VCAVLTLCAAVMHCHIDWHLAEGFAAVIVVQPDAIAQMTIPSANTAVSCVIELECAQSADLMCI
jgi:hypothetical protein